ncbi:MAG: AsmA family protein [Moraxellaceae bacterium]
MKRALIITAAVIGGLFALIGIALAVLLLVVDPNDYKGEIAALVKDQTDMTLTLDDRLEWTLWPSIGVKLGKLALTDAEAGETLVAVDKAAVSVQVMPLFSRRIAVDAVLLDGAQLRHIQRADGTTSWDRMLAKLKSEETPPESEKVAFKVSHLDVKNTALYLKDEAAGIERRISNITVTARDIDPDAAFPFSAGFDFSEQQADGKTLKAKNSIAATVRMDQAAERYVLTGLTVNSALSGSLLPAPTVLALGADIDADMKAQQVKVDKLALDVQHQDPALKAPATVKLTGTVLADLAAQKVSVDGLDVAASYFPKELPATATVEMKAGVVADLKATTATITALKLTAGWPDAAQRVATALAGNLSVNWSSGEVATPQLALNITLASRDFPQPIAASVNAPFTANYLQGELKLPALVLEALGVRMEGHVQASLPALRADAAPGTPVTAGMEYSGGLGSNTFSPRKVMAALGIAAPDTADKAVLGSASLRTTFMGDDKKVMLQGLRVVFDDSTLTGEAGITDLASLRQFARLSIDRLNADRYLPPPAPASKTTPPPAASAPPAAAELIPVDVVKSLNLDAVLGIGNLTLMTYDISNFRLAVTAGNGVVNVSEFRGSILNGGFSAPVSLNVQGAQPVIRLQPKLERMDIAPLAKTVLKRDLLAGRASFNGNLTVTGNTVDALTKSVTGDSTLRFDDGVLHGVNAMNELTRALGQYEALLPLLTGKDAATLLSKQNDTQIASFLSEHTIENGVLKSKSFNTDLRQAKVTGGGSFNLVTQDLDYQFNLALDKSVLGDKYAGYTLPVKCKGSLHGELTKLCGLDSRAIRDMVTKAAMAKGLEKLGLQGGTVNEVVDAKKAEAEAAVQQKVEEEKQKAREKVNEKINEGLNRLFKR